MYAKEPVLEGFWDDVKAAAGRLKQVKPLQVIAREAGLDPQGTLTVAPSASTAGFVPTGGFDLKTLAIIGIVAYLVMRRK